MPKLVYVRDDGSEQIVDVSVGSSVMRGAIDASVPGVEADCGGCLSCATCHVYVSETDLGRLPPASDEEKALLDGVAAPRLESSRLSCQIFVTESLEGLTVRVPPRQS